MAQQGNFAALQRLQPTQGLSRDVQYWNSDAARRRNENRIEENIQYQREQARKKAQSELYDKWVKPGQMYDTGSASLNEVLARGLSQAREQYLPNLQILENPNASQEEKIKARLRLDNLNQLPERFKTVTDKYTAEWNAYQEAKQNGNAYDQPELDKAFQGGFKSYEIGLDDMANPVIAFVDKNGDGQNDLIGAQTFDQISQGMPLFDWQKKYNIDTMAEDVAKRIGTTDKTEVTNGGFGSIQEKSANIDGIRTAAQKLFYDANGGATEVAKSALREAGLDYQNPTAQDLLQVEDSFVKQAMSYTDYMRKETLDASGQTSRMRENRLASGDNPNAVITEPVNPSQEVWGDAYSTIAPNAKSVGVNGVKLSAIRDGENIITDANVQNVTYDANGNMLVDVVYQSSKSSVYTREVNELKELIENISKSKEAAAETGDQKAVQMFDERIKENKLELDRLTTGSQNKRKVVRIPKEDEASVAQQLGGIEAIKQRVGVQNNTTQNNDPLGIFE